MVANRGFGGRRNLGMFNDVHVGAVNALRGTLDLVGIPLPLPAFLEPLVGQARAGLDLTLMANGGGALGQLARQMQANPTPTALYQTAQRLNALVPVVGAGGLIIGGGATAMLMFGVWHNKFFHGNYSDARRDQFSWLTMKESLYSGKRRSQRR